MTCFSINISGVISPKQLWSPEFFRKRALPHGEYVLACIEKILASHDYPEINYKRSLGIIHLHRAYGSGRLNNACKRALDTDSCSYLRIKNILKNNMDRLVLSVSELETQKPHITFSQQYTRCFRI